MWLLPEKLKNTESFRSAVAVECSTKAWPQWFTEHEWYVLSSGKVIRRPSSWSAWKNRPWHLRLFGAAISNKSTGLPGLEQWIGSLRDSRANRSVPQESRKVSTIPGGFGKPLPMPSRPFVRSMSSLRMSMGLERLDSPASSKALWRSGTGWNGVVFERPTLERPTADAEYSSWPTPTGGDARMSGSTGDSGNHGVTLTDATVRGNLWPTPMARDGKDTICPAEFRRKSPHLAVISLKTVADLWPTPTASDDNKSPRAALEAKAKMPGGARTKITSLQVVGKTWDGFGVHFSHPVPENLMDGKCACGGRLRLNPLFVNWLMGWPMYWSTIRKHSTSQATASYLYRQRLRYMALLIGRASFRSTYDKE